MDIGLTQSTYEPYATTNYKTTQTTTSTTYQNVDLGNFKLLKPSTTEMP